MYTIRLSLFIACIGFTLLMQASNTNNDRLKTQLKTQNINDQKKSTAPRPLSTGAISKHNQYPFTSKTTSVDDLCTIANTCIEKIDTNNQDLSNMSRKLQQNTTQFTNAAQFTNNSLNTKINDHEYRINSIENIIEEHNNDIALNTISIDTNVNETASIFDTVFAKFYDHDERIHGMVTQLNDHDKRIIEVTAYMIQHQSNQSIHDQIITRLNDHDERINDLTDRIEQQSHQQEETPKTKDESNILYRILCSIFSGKYY